MPLEALKRWSTPGEINSTAAAVMWLTANGPNRSEVIQTGGSWVGALDMAGNVMEWVQDWLGPYSANTAENPTGPATGKVKVEKGGWWGGPSFVARSAYRHFEDPPEYGDKHIGLRVVTP